MLQILLEVTYFIGMFYISVVLMRFILQVSRADFYNPISQFVVKATNPLLLPLRKIIPGWRGLDFASLVLALLLSIVLIIVITLTPLSHILPLLGLIVTKAVLLMLKCIINIYQFAIFIMVIISWVAPGSYHPGAQLVHQITEPLMRPVRRIMPPIGGLDLSPMVVLLVLFVIGRALSIV
ncbi:predicted integral membrane protein [Hahella chejuensis KCTC 2396]|uniref:Predicted integral membrane protein n=1 Tax=Hahella chejuensis (strain KCTC 2396) TaxID=349521 RepID=Q2S8M3_HAHCH|nr:YggT family protein [Hahella chejuensis]ABC33001.1 predicted integral membrane protein [Hahella chejuensis KCTC 2396]